MDAVLASVLKMVCGVWIPDVCQAELPNWRGSGGHLSSEQESFPDHVLVALESISGFLSLLDSEILMRKASLRGVKVCPKGVCSLWLGVVRSVWSQEC